MRRQYTNKKDANHKAIVKKLEQIGAAVFDLSDVKKEGFDTLVSYQGQLYPVEIKNPDYLPKKFFSMPSDEQTDYLVNKMLTNEERAAYNKLERTGNRLIITYSFDHCLRSMGVGYPKPFSSNR